MYGTNDATAQHWDRCGEEGTQRAMWLLLTELRRVSHTPPLMLLVTPPPVLGEFTGRGCVAMHSCRYHPSKACGQLAECVSCGKGDLVDAPTCVRAKVLPIIRRIVGALGQQLGAMRSGAHRRVSREMRIRMPRGPPPPSVPTMSLPPSTSSWVGTLVAAAPPPRLSSSQCTTDAVSVLSGTQLVPANSAMFTGPVHLNAKASALIACNLFDALARQCVIHGDDDGGGCGSQAHGTPGADDVVLSQASTQSGSRRQRAFCGNLRSSLHQSEDPPDAHWNALQGALHNWVGLNG